MADIFNNSTTFYLEVRDDYKNIFNLLNYVQELSSSGHSFPIDVDNGYKTIVIDGDGACHIYKIEILTRGSREVRKFNLRRLFGFEGTVLYKISCLDADHQIRELLQEICSNSQMGHTLDFIVDFDDKEFRKSFEIDGDGSDMACMRKEEISKTWLKEARII